MFKVWILAHGESTYATNGLTFDSVPDSVKYANDLMSRWFSAKEFAVLDVNEKNKGFLSIEYIKTNALAEG